VREVTKLAKKVRNETVKPWIQAFAFKCNLYRYTLVASLTPSSGVPAGGERVTVSAANLAPSRWLKIDLGAGVGGAVQAESS
jgi:hypothetical protein